MLYRPALHDNWNALSLARRALKDKAPTLNVPLPTVLQNRQVFLPNPVYKVLSHIAEQKHIKYLLLFQWRLEVLQVYVLDSSC
jgi:hypothetical protein